MYTTLSRGTNLWKSKKQPGSFNLSADRNHHRPPEMAALATSPSAHFNRTAQRRPSLPAEDMQLANHSSTIVPQETNSQCNPFCSRLSIQPNMSWLCPSTTASRPPRDCDRILGDGQYELPKKAVPGWHHRQFGAYRRERSEDDTREQTLLLISRHVSLVVSATSLSWPDITPCYPLYPGS
jgi:hypothetical protein